MRLRLAIRENPLTATLAKQYTQGIATIFMLHRVEQLVHPRLTPNEDLKVSPEYLLHTIRTLRRQHYSFVSIDELHEVLIHRKQVSKLAVFTLDDGYRDNLTNALPVFESVNVPFTVYVTNCFPNGTANLWWFELEKLIQENDYVRFDAGYHFSLRTPAEKWESFLQIRSLFLQGKIRREEIQVHTGPVSSQMLCMNWDEVQKLSRHSLVTIGAHTMSHPALSTLPTTEAYAEIQSSREELEQKLHRKIEHFAYPFGEKQQAGQREFDMAQEIGFKTAVTTRAGNIFPQHRQFLTALPRIYLHENNHQLDRLMYTNVFWNNKFKRVVTI